MRVELSLALDAWPLLHCRMVLMRQRLSLEQQQMLVEHTQSISHLFRRPRTAGGGQYHILLRTFPFPTIVLLTS